MNLSHRSVVLAHMGAQNVPELFVAAFAEEVQIDLAQGRQEPVGVVDNVLDPVVVGDSDPVVRDRGGGQDPDPDAFELMGELDHGAVSHLGNHSVRQRFERAHSHGAIVWVRAQQRMWVVILSGDQILEIATVDRLHR